MSLNTTTNTIDDLYSLATSNPVFLEGNPGCGKTSIAQQHLLNLINSGIPLEKILVLVPQRSLGKAYQEIFNRIDLPAGGVNTVLTFNGLAQRMITLYWPVILESAGFQNPEQEPVFLTLESAQYYLSSIVHPLLEEGYFDTIKIDENRLLGQILDNLNKAAFVGFPHTQIAEKLISSWAGKPEQLRVFDEVQICADKFRKFCYANNLLDFSLQIELFSKYLWPSSICRDHLKEQYPYLIYDNIEEDVPAAHDLVIEWLPMFKSALFVYNQNSGYRSFLGADPASALRLKEECQHTFRIAHSHICPSGILNFQSTLKNIILRESKESQLDQINEHISFQNAKFFPELITQICVEIQDLIEKQNIPAGEIAVLSPFLSDSLRFTLQNELQSLGIQSRTNRPSRSLVDEPAAQCLLSIAKLAHPDWKLELTNEHIRLALMQAIEGLDLIRADLLSRIIFKARNFENALSSFYQIRPEMQERISYTYGEYYEIIMQWIKDYQASGMVLPLDHFISKLFGEVLSQPGFGFHNDLDAASLCSKLIESIFKFRRTVAQGLEQDYDIINQEYLRMLDQGILAAQYLLPESEDEQDAVFISPAYTYLMSNQNSQIQFWLDISSMGWWERINQPLTHPIILSRSWQDGRKWTDNEEFAHNQSNLGKLLSGLSLRCSGRIFLCTSKVNEQGSVQKGPLLQAVQVLVRQMHLSEEVQHV